MMKNIVAQRGQALVEAALFLPIFIVLLGGVVEVSQITITKNRVATAAKASTRFGANGGENQGMVAVYHNVVTQTMTLEEERWDMWTFRGTINDVGDNFEKWELEHSYGISSTVDSALFSSVALQMDILKRLKVDHRGGALSRADISNMEIIGTYLIFDSESLLGLSGFDFLHGMYSVSSLSVLPLNAAVESSNGCSGFPIAVHEGARSVTPPGEGANPYPNRSDFSYPIIPRAYESFAHHRPNIALADAQEGDVFKVQNGFGAGNFGWLLWNQGRQESANTLADSLTWPGDSIDYTDHGDSSIFPAADAYDHIVRGYVEPGDTTDTSMHIGDWVAANTGAVNAIAVRSALNESIDRNRAMRLIVWDGATQSGSNGTYRIKGFAIFELEGYRLESSGSWILAKFIRWDTSCGETTDS